jgi:hypothetical protein
VFIAPRRPPMAKIHAEEISINVLQLVKDNGMEQDILTPEIREAIASVVVPMIEELLGPAAVVEIK